MRGGPTIDQALPPGLSIALTISGEKKVVKEDDELGYHRTERSYGCFVRDIPLSDVVETDKIAAKFKNGVLTLTLPKTEKAIKEPKKIHISAG